MKKLFFTFLLFLPALGLPAQQLDFTAQQVPAEVSFAQPFDVHFELAHTPGYTPQLDKDSLPEGFTLTAEKQEARSPGTVSYDLTFMPFTLGASTFTAVNVWLTDARGDILARAASEPKQITVKPVQFFKDKTLRDIRPPYIPSGWLSWVLGALALGAAYYGLRRWWRRWRNRARQAQDRPDTRPADIIALSKIQILLQSGLWENAQYKLFYSELGEILREYFWRRFGLDVSSDTSAELLRRARHVPELASQLPSLRDYLNSSDLVKFAKLTPATPAMQRDVQAVQQLVQATAPRPQTSPGQEEK